VHLAVPRDRLAGAVDAAGFAGITACDASFGGRVALRAVELPFSPVAAGERFVVTTFWEALSDIGKGGPLSLCLEVGGVECAGVPAAGTMPPSRWPRGQLLPHAFVVDLPADTAAGRHPVRIWVRDRTGDLPAAGGVPAGRAVLEVAR
jgi:hypothetical protein